MLDCWPRVASFTGLYSAIWWGVSSTHPHFLINMRHSVDTWIFAMRLEHKQGSIYLGGHDPAEQAFLAWGRMRWKRGISKQCIWYYPFIAASSDRLYMISLCVTNRKHNSLRPGRTRSWTNRGPWYLHIDRKLWSATTTLQGLRMQNPK